MRSWGVQHLNQRAESSVSKIFGISLHAKQLNPTKWFDGKFVLLQFVGQRNIQKGSKLWCPAHGLRWWRWSRQPWLQQQSSPGAMRPCSTRLSSRSWAWRMCSTATWQGPKIDFLRITTSDCLMVWWFCFEIYWLSQWLTFKLLGTTYL